MSKRNSKIEDSNSEFNNSKDISSDWNARDKEASFSRWGELPNDSKGLRKRKKILENDLMILQKLVNSATEIGNRF